MKEALKPGPSPVRNRCQLKKEEQKCYETKGLRINTKCSVAIVKQSNVFRVSLKKRRRNELDPSAANEVNIKIVTRVRGGNKKKGGNGTGGTTVESWALRSKAHP